MFYFYYAFNQRIIFFYMSVCVYVFFLNEKYLVTKKSKNFF